MTGTASIKSNLIPCAGLIVPALLWAVNTQLGQILPYSECGAPLKWAALSSLLAAPLSLGAGWASWRATRRDRGAAMKVTAYPASLAFVGLLSGLSGAVFAFALSLQGLASLVLTGCER